MTLAEEINRKARVRENRIKVIRYLETATLPNALYPSGRLFFKSKLIADKLELPSREVGGILAELERDPEGPFIVTRWSYCKGTRWEIRPRQNNANENGTIVLEGRA